LIKFALSRIWNRKLTSILIVLAFFSLYLLIPLGLTYSKESKLRVEQSIEQFGRGTYDILVRPASSRTNIEKELGIVEENYVGDSRGGITIEEWEQIKSHPEIEVAAPVASIGYFSGKRLSVNLPLLNESVRYTWEFYTSDGIRQYSLSEPQSLIYFKESVPGNIQYLKNIQNGETASGAAMEFMLPPTYHLLVAIDIESEQKLTNIDYSELNNDLDPNELEIIRMNFGDIPIIKVIQREDINIPLMMKLKKEVLNVSISDYRKKLGISEQDWLMAADDNKREQVFKELIEKESISSSEYEIDLTSFQKPFDGTAVELNSNFEVELASQFVADRGHTPVYFIAEKLKYHNQEGKLKVDIVKNGSPPSYKEVKEKGKTLYESTDVPFLIEQVGTFSPLNQHNNILTSSPLGIYSTTDIKTEQGQTLKATTIPGSFIPQPAGGITTLEAAELIKGESPIDAIRIRVAGIEAYNKEAQEKIERVASDLLEKGYEIDIVAGSSFKKTSVQVEGIGTVIEPWTTLGTAQELVTSWNFITIISTILFSIFGIVWIFSRAVFEKNLLAEENELLYNLGWQKRNILKRNLMEQWILMTLAFVLTCFTFVILKVETDSFLITGVLWVISMTFVYFLQSLKNAKRTRTQAYTRFPAFMYYRSLIFPTMLVLVVSSSLVGIQISNIGSVMEQSSLTSLGNFVVDLTLGINIALLLSTLILASIAICECMNCLLTKRKSELNMYHTIGWTRKQIFFKVAKEVLGWTLIAILSGLLFSGTTLLFIEISLKWILIGFAISSTLMFLIVYVLVSLNTRLALK